MVYYSAIKSNELMKFLGKCMELENIIPSEVTQSQKNTHDMHSLADKWILAPKLGTYKIQLTDHMKLKKEYQSVDTLILIGKWVKIHSQPIEWA